MAMRIRLFFLGVVLVLSGCRTAKMNTEGAAAYPPAKSSVPVIPRVVSSASSVSAQTYDDSTPWHPDLTDAQIHILRDRGTETPFTSPLLDEHRPGTFVSADCGEPVFRSEQKYDSGTGWPSFWAPINPDSVVEVRDDSLGVTRTEIRSKCGGHLGHVFTDGPEPTGLRYCMNGLALRFIPD